MRGRIEALAFDSSAVIGGLAFDCKYAVDISMATHNRLKALEDAAKSAQNQQPAPLQFQTTPEFNLPVNPGPPAFQPGPLSSGNTVSTSPVPSPMFPSMSVLTEATSGNSSVTLRSSESASAGSRTAGVHIRPFTPI
jgi:hypothetical protein